MYICCPGANALSGLEVLPYSIVRYLNVLNDTLRCEVVFVLLCNGHLLRDSNGILLIRYCLNVLPV